MKTKLVTLNDFIGHPHPASKFFRLIELQTIYQQTKKTVFKEPSMDLGGGDGYLSSILFDKKFTYNLDNGEAKDLEVAKKFKRYKKILIESAEKMSLPSNSLNFVFSNSVIEHIPDNDAVLSEVSRTLIKGGVFVFTSPSDKFREYLWISSLLTAWGLNPLGNLYKNHRNKMLNHYHTYSHKTWIEKLKKHGLIVKKYKYYITKDNCIFWDKLAWEVRLRKLFDANAERNVYKKYKNEIIYRSAEDQVKNTEGASLFIYAVKE